MKFLSTPKSCIDHFKAYTLGIRRSALEDVSNRCQHGSKPNRMGEGGGKPCSWLDELDLTPEHYTADRVEAIESVF